MLDTLLESKSHRTRGKGTALASAAFHATVILGTVYATASGASAHNAPEPPARVHWVRSPPSRDPVSQQTRRIPPSTATSRVAIPATLRVRLNIPVGLPPIDLNRPVVDPSDFASSATHSTGDPTASPGDRVPGGVGLPAYDASQVDTPVSMIGTFRPDYPAALRSAGVEGQVVVQFVVNEAGRVDRASVRIVSASNDVFAFSVTTSLARMRFTPARIGSRAVAQLVQQMFVFRLDR
jgi:TonB family protein